MFVVCCPLLHVVSCLLSVACCSFCVVVAIVLLLVACYSFGVVVCRASFVRCRVSFFGGCVLFVAC